jgi:hypothetical protein
MELFKYIEMFYNPTRRHSALGYVSPNEYERRYAGRTPALIEPGGPVLAVPAPTVRRAGQGQPPVVALSLLGRCALSYEGRHRGLPLRGLPPIFHLSSGSLFSTMIFVALSVTVLEVWNR